MSSSSHTCQFSHATDLDGERLRLAVDGGRGDVQFQSRVRSPRPTDLDGERLRLAVDGGRGDVQFQSHMSGLPPY